MHSLALTRKVELEGGSFVSEQTQNFFKKDFYPTQRVRQSCPILSANCSFRHILRLFRLFRGDRSGMDKSSSATCLLYIDVVKVDPSPTWLRKYQEEDEEEAVKRAIKDSEIFVSEIFHNFFLQFFSITLLYHFFHTFFPTTSTHDPRRLATLGK